MPRPSKPVEEKKVTISARITPTELAELERMASTDRRTVSFLVADAVREYLERHAAKSKRGKP